MKEEGVSVCITAYKAKDYIKECLDSVVNQSWFRTHDNWEIIVGIDGCEETLEYMKTIMGNYKNLRVLMMDCNKGTYVTSNTIMTEAKYEHLFRFDSDDIMCPNLVETILKKKGDCSFVRYSFKSFGNSTKMSVAFGTVYMSSTLFSKCGGYRPWPCSADSELYYRIRFFEKTKILNDILMYRRGHTDSLTQSAKTGMKSDTRKPYLEISRKMRESDKPIVDFKIECVTNTFKEIEQPVNNVDKDEYMKSLENKVWSYMSKANRQTKESQLEKYNKIMQLRKDIANGKVVKIKVGEGKFVWKRIK